MSYKKIIISLAHDWVSKNYNKEKLVCTKCNIETFVGQWPKTRCKSSLEFVGSGFIDETLLLDKYKHSVVWC